jgi:hypothetical protein
MTIKQAYFIFILILCSIHVGYVRPTLVEDVDALDGISEKRDRLMIEEIQWLEESIDNINAALEEENYTNARDAIDTIRSGDNWLNVRYELELRNEGNLIYSFNESMSAAKALFANANSSSIEQVQLLSRDLDKIVQALGNPVVDLHRLILTIAILGALIGAGLYVIPKFRKHLNIKY